MKQPHNGEALSSCKNVRKISRKCFTVISKIVQREYIVWYILFKKDKPEINENSYVYMLGGKSGRKGMERRLY